MFIRHPHELTEAEVTGVAEGDGSLNWLSKSHLKPESACIGKLSSASVPGPSKFQPSHFLPINGCVVQEFYSLRGWESTADQLSCNL